MALYPYTIANALPQGIQTLGPGAAVVIPLTLAADQRLHLDVVQATGNMVQDFTIRSWISREPLGSPDPSLPPFVQSWQAHKTPGTMVICFFDPSSQEADTVFAIPAVPGEYFINVLNLTNQSNEFWLTVEDATDTNK